MTKKLKTKILRMMARASRIHNLSSKDFWKLTPLEWSLIEKDHQEEWQFEETAKDRRTARLLLAIFKASPKFKKVNKKEEDFMPVRRGAKLKNVSAENLLIKGEAIRRRMEAVQRHNEKIKNGS